MKDLREELEAYKVRLARYEVIERQRDSSSLMTYKLIKSELKPQPTTGGHDALEEARRIEANMKDFTSRYNFESQERRQAVEQLARTTIEIILPFTHKYLMWAAANNSGFFNAENMETLGLGCGAKDDWNSIVEESHATEEECMGAYESKTFLANTASVMHKLVTQFISCQRQIQEQMKQLDEYIYQVMIPKLSLSSLDFFVKWVEQVQLFSYARG